MLRHNEYNSCLISKSCPECIYILDLQLIEFFKEIHSLYKKGCMSEDAAVFSLFSALCLSCMQFFPRVHVDGIWCPNFQLAQATAASTSTKVEDKDLEGNLRNWHHHS